MSQKNIIILICVHLIILNNIEAYRILGICPSTSYSHQQPFKALMKALAVRHNVTVISPVPLKIPVNNYEDIDLSFSYSQNDCTGFRFYNAFSLLRKNMIDANQLCEKQLLSDPVKELIHRNLTFDAIIIEHLWFQCYYSLVHHYNFPPLIGFLSVGNLPYVMDSIGNPDDPLLNPDMAFGFNERMNIPEQIINYFYTFWSRMYFKYSHLPYAEAIANKLIPNTPVPDIQGNFSLIILGNNHVFGYAKPLLPNVIEVQGLHISDSHMELPEDLKQFLDESLDGVIYFSLGSNLKTHQLPNHIQSILCNTFNSLKQRVLWKHDGVPFANSSNVKLIMWAPQQAILAHHNTRLYIMQGGLQSLQEAVHYHVPVIALPFFGDQNFNARKIVDLKIGLSHNIDSITEETLKKSIDEIFINEEYKSNIQKIGAIIQDEQVKPIQKVVWNIEHLLKFPNASHFRYHGSEISSIRYYIVLTILTFIKIVIFIVNAILLIFIKIMTFIVNAILLLFIKITMFLRYFYFYFYTNVILLLVHYSCILLYFYFINF